MATYNDTLKGYIADVPRVVFRRCDGAKYYFDELTSATVSADMTTTEITAGWSLYPVAVLPGASTFTMSFTSGKFDSSMFSMANAIKDVPEANTDHAWRTNGSYVMSTGERVTPDATNHQVTLLHPAVNNSVYISGMVETGENVVATGYFKVTTADGVTTVTFSADDSYLENVEIVYDYVQEVHEAVVTNMESAIGECVAIWPVYGSADDCSESDIIGYYIVKVFRARITQVPGINETSSPCVQQCTYKNFPNTEKLLAA